MGLDWVTLEVFSNLNDSVPLVVAMVVLVTVMRFPQLWDSTV